MFIPSERQAEDRSAGMAKNLETARQFCVMMQESDVGVAVYDSFHRLLASTPSYRKLRAVSESSMTPGTRFEEIICQVLEADGFSRAEADAVVTHDLDRLKKAGKDTVYGEDAAGNSIKLTRHVKSSGMLIETIDVHQLSHIGSDDSEVAEFQTYAKRLNSALENMPDGFCIFNPDGILVALNERYRELQPHIKHRANRREFD